jgi:23S rRNA (guanosine2251-2'-O)-methyltransferase
MIEIVLLIHDIRSTHNVGSLFRTAESLGVSHIYISGYTPYPAHEGDQRLPHIRNKLHSQIEKTALGATQLVQWSHHESITALIEKLKNDGYMLIALEQDSSSIALPDWTPPDKLALLVGREVEGIDDTLLQSCDSSIEIPQFGKKESLNVVQATAIALYRAQFAK